MAFSAITQKAMQLIAAEEAEKRAAALKLEATAAAAAAEKERTELQARLALQAERELARIQAERLLAEQQAVAAREAESAALKAEIDRLRNRSETEILRDELANLRAEIAAMRQQTQALPTKQILQESIYSHLRADGELDMRFRSSKQELSVVQQEVVELKDLVNQILMAMSGCPRHASEMGGYSTDQNQYLLIEKQKQYWQQNHHSVVGKGGALLRAATQ